MHIPDGMLDTKTWAITWAGAAACIGTASLWVRKHFDSSKIVLMAVLAALIFGLQMFNFPIAGGTSGHFGGGVAAGIIVGPWPASLIMSAVLLVQALFFGDGGITTLGANIVNMGIIAPFVGWAIYTAISRASTRKMFLVLSAFLASLVGVLASALACSLELWASGNAHFFAIAGAMLFWHTLIGIGEGIITAGLVTYLAKVRPEILTPKDNAPPRSLRGVAITLAIIAVLVAGLSFLASTHPDGLEFVASQQGIGSVSLDKPLIASPLDNYALPGVANSALAKGIAGVIGAALVGGLLWAVAASVKRRQARRSEERAGVSPHNDATKPPENAGSTGTERHTGAEGNARSAAAQEGDNDG